MRGLWNAARRKLHGRDRQVRAVYQDLIRTHYRADLVERCMAWNAQTLAPLIRPIMRVAQADFDEGIYAGILPTTSPIACARRCDGGAMILVSVGMLSLITDYALATARSIRLPGEDRPVGDILLLEPVQFRSLTMKLREIAAADETLMLPPPGGLPGIVGPEVGQASGARYRMEQKFLLNFLWFIIAHEFSHVTLDHLWKAHPDRATLDELRPYHRHMMGSVFSWIEEMDADAEAMRMLFKTRPDHWEEPYFGLVLFSEMADALFPVPVNTTHPHPLVRRSATVSTLDAERGRKEFVLAEDLAANAFLQRIGQVSPDDPSDFRLPGQDEGALEQVQAWGRAHDPDSAFGGVLYQGVRLIDMESMDAILSRDFGSARAAVAHHAHAMVSVPIMYQGSYIVRYGMYFDHFCRIWTDHPELGAFKATLKAAVPYLDALEDIWRRSHFVVGGDAPD